MSTHTKLEMKKEKIKKREEVAKHPTKNHTTRHTLQNLIVLTIGHSPHKHLKHDNILHFRTRKSAWSGTYKVGGHS